MEITIDIPNAFRTDEDMSMINIYSDNFNYASPSRNMYGLQSKYSQIDKLKEDNLYFNLHGIEKIIRNMIKEDFI